MTLRLTRIALAAAALTACASSPTPTQRAADAVQTREPSRREQADALRKTDRAAAKALYIEACDDGDGEACQRVELTVGDAEADQRLAARCVERGCELGHAFSCSRLAQRHWTGLGVEVDHARAVELDQQACDLGEKSSCQYAEKKAELVEKYSTEELTRRIADREMLMDAVIDAVQTAAPAKQCQAEADVTGPINMRFKITPDGRIADLKTKAPGSATEACLQRVLATIELPTGYEKTINYLITIQPGE